MQSKPIIRIVRGVAAMMIGYVIIVVLTSLGFNGVLGGRPLYGGSLSDSAAGMMIAVVSGLVGGCTAGFVGAGRQVLNATLVLIPLTGDTIYVLFFFKRNTAPFWFDVLASGTLMTCTVLGGLLSERVGRRRKAPA